MKLFFVAALAMMMSNAVLAVDAGTIVGPKDCQLVHWDELSDVDAKWTGPCKDGFADGEGKLEWTRLGKITNTYEGGMRRGRYHGMGYSTSADNAQYEGYYVDGKRDGFGIFVDQFGNRYDGQWKAGLRHGSGKQVYAIGGSYEGAWQDGKYHGKGTIVYPGGRRAEYQFENGHWPDAPPPTATENLPIYKLRSNDDRRGASMKVTIGKGGPLPFDLGYAQMSPEQKRLIAAEYPLMDPADEPPYPLRGTGTVLGEIANRVRRVAGVLTLIVKVGANGQAKSVTAFGEPDRENAELAAQLAMNEKYKPAMCAGKPCEMFYYYEMRFVD
ncbi:MORN repeat-containing protein [Herminiimonas sp.]|uniref:MORN repeat-containing protein n=1 Tax=Herminiimonas sp. TaxID=1926289 RepID=UPI0027222DEF|nr:hypothetical protein [Herminiimonas sp.]MDO8304824.1 hypothetical protein [Herminiimonas sp.]